MTFLRTGFEWLDRLMPDGIGIPSSTIISGPGGSGKPVVANAFAIAWLEAGGSVIFMPLQYPDKAFVVAGITALGRLSLDDYADRVSFILLDPQIQTWHKTTDGSIRANLVKPHVWDEAIARAAADLPEAGPGILIVGSALNLLLFSPHYGTEILEKIKQTFLGSDRRTYLFSISTSAQKDQAAQIENAADNLLLTRSVNEPDFQLFLRVVRLTGARAQPGETRVNIPPAVFNELRDVAENTRTRIIPLIRHGT